MRMITRLATVVAILFSCVQFSSCGSAAPPVSLPTPVTGRITVSSPDSSGNIAVTGEAGSVTASSTVMAINTSVAAGLNRPLAVISKIFLSQAFASTDSNSFPNVCSETGHACALADANGAFELSIPGSASDSIAIVEVDATTGADESERITRSVPDNIFPFTHPVLDIAMNPYKSGQLLVLTSCATSDTNVLVEYNPSTNVQTEHALSSDYGSVTKLAVNSHYIAIGTDSGYYILSSFEGSAGSFSAFSATQLSTSYTPSVSDMFFDANGYLWISSSSVPPSIIVAYPSEGEILNVFAIPDESGLTHTGVKAIALGTISETGVIVALAEFSSTSTGETTTKIIMYSTYDLSWSSSSVEPLATLTLGSGTVSEDIAFYESDAHLIVTDKGRDEINFYNVSASASGGQETTYSLSADGGITSTDYSYLTNPLRIAVTDGYALITANNSTDTMSDTAFTVNLTTQSATGTPTEVGLIPDSIVYYSSGSYVFVGCSTSQTITRLTFSEATLTSE